VLGPMKHSGLGSASGSFPMFLYFVGVICAEIIASCSFVLICTNATVELEEFGTSIPNPPTKEVHDNGTLVLVLFVVWTSCCFLGIHSYWVIFKYILQFLSQIDVIIHP